MCSSHGTTALFFKVWGGRHSHLQDLIEDSLVSEVRSRFVPSSSSWILWHTDPWRGCLAWQGTWSYCWPLQTLVGWPKGCGILTMGSLGACVIGAGLNLYSQSGNITLLFCERWNQVRAGYLPGINLILGRQVACLCNNRNKTVSWQEYINLAKEQFLSCPKTKIRFFPVIDPEKSWHIPWILNFMSMCKSQAGEVVES